MRSETLPPYTATDEQETIAWERALNEEVCRSVVKLWEAASRPEKVFIAVDGVVPMAKIKQQRMRRFKSIWWAEREYEMGVRARGPRWDTNSITPGTAYMERLGARLHELCASRGWILSSSDEPGEGEHKVMEWIRRGGVKASEGSVVIYGLDADLILLSMLTGCEHLDAPIILMREKTEFGKEAARFASAPFLFFSTGHLLNTLCNSDKSFLLDYIAVMSLLGNDFLPHGLTLKIREGGHDWLLQKLREFREKGKYFVEYETKQVIYDTFRELFGIMALEEERWLSTAIFKKKTMRPMAPRNDTERLMMSVQNLPIEWFVEKEFLDKGQLAANWKDIYHRHTPIEACSEYLYGIQWIVNYYVGKPVDMMWFYPWHLPPMWGDLSTAHQVSAHTSTELPLQPQEQLALVLPMESWHLLRNKQLRKAPGFLPQFWPTQFGFMSLGKSWMWECEADIPILLPGRLRSLV